MSPVVTNAARYLLGLTLSCVANRSWKFKSPNGHLSDLLRFGGAYARGFLMSVLSMSLLVRIISAPLAQILTIGVTAIVIFCAQRLVRFGGPGSRAVNSIR